MGMRSLRLLASGFVFGEGEAGLMFKFKILNTIMLIAACFSLLFAVVSDLGINDLGPIHTTVDYLYSALSIVLIVLLRHSKAWFTYVATAFLVGSLLTFISALHYVPQDEFRLIWFYFLIYVTYVLLGSRAGVVMTATILAVVITSALTTDLQLSQTALFTGVLGLLIGSLLSRTHTVQIRCYEGLLKEKNAALQHNVTELDTALQSTQEADRAKSLFLANISHELRTPMNGILGMVQVMQTTGLTDEQRHYVENIDRSGKSLLVLLDELLDLSKIESNTLALKAAPFDLFRWVSDVLMFTEPMFEDGYVAFTTEVDSDLPKFLVGDATRLMQIVVNLVVNAAKFTSDGWVQLHIVSAGCDAGQCRLRISVEDTGIGIPADKQQEVFATFAQLSRDRIANKGVGLGLSISSQLVAVMGGKLQLESREGQGSRFWFEVDLKVASAEQAREVAAPHADLERPLRVLLVDDDAINRLAVNTWLRNKRHHVDEAINGHEAIERLAQNSYDVVLMDVHMPGMDGVEATRLIRSSEQLATSLVPIIGLTASVMKNEREEYLAAGMSAVVTKPVLFEDLMHTVQSCLDREKREQP